jgi:hypothetical protein
MRRWLPVLGAAAGVVVGPGWWCGRGADAWRDPDQVAAYARGVDRWLEGDLRPENVGTGGDLFDGEWWFMTHTFAAVGHVQASTIDVERRAEHLDAAEAWLRPLLDCDGWRFDTDRWGSCALDDLGTTRDHAVFGYVALPLALLEAERPDGPLAGWSERIVTHLEARLDASESGLLTTYPGEAYPADTSMALAATAVRGRATGRVNHRRIQRWSELLQDRYQDDSGLVAQSASPDGRYVGRVRGSGSMAVAWAMSFADRETSAEIWQGARAHLYVDGLGFAALREVPAGEPAAMDVDSGPVLLGVGLSVTGFALGVAKAHDDHGAFRRLWATAHLFGGPTTIGDERAFVSGGALGDALLFALCTTQPAYAGRST